MSAPGRMTTFAPSQLPDPMRTAASTGHCWPMGYRVGVGVVLVGDVDVRPGLDVVADLDLQWPTMWLPRPMRQRLPMRTTGSVGIS